jgi:endonuclease/exonuclease/phosphatase family metal-dependent hydrolase
MGQDNQLLVFNAHLSAFAQGDDTMQRQVAQVAAMLEQASESNIPWIMGGDFNLLPPGQYEQLPDSQKIYYEKETELETFLNKYQSVPSLADQSGPDYMQRFTYFSNDPRISAPDRTIDYIFYSEGISLTDSRVRQQDTLTISEHLPVIAEFKLH